MNRAKRARCCKARYRAALEAIADELVCPITHELPVDPVIAQDGRVYDRRAIAEWVASCHARGLPLTSPVTREVMGSALLPARHALHVVRRVVESDAVRDDKAEAWKQQLADEAHVKDVHRDATSGNALAMHELGSLHFHGHRGVRMDRAEAFRWFRYAADRGFVSSLATCARMYVDGLGVDANVPRGLVLFGQAAGQGSEHACFMLGLAHHHGMYGCDADDAEAARWFGAMAACPHKDATEQLRDMAIKCLVDHHGAA
jgi:TPR repeat protein